MREALLRDLEAALAAAGQPGEVDHASWRPGPFPFELHDALRIARRDLELGGAAVPVVERAARAWGVIAPTEGGGGFERLLGSDEDDEVLGPATSEELTGALALTADHAWWLVLEGSAAGTVWASWEDRWVPLAIGEAGAPRLASIAEWVRLLSRAA